MRILKFFLVVRGPASFAGLSWLLVAILLSGVMDSEAADARIAVAANFRDTAVTIATVLEQESSYRYEVIVGSTGKLASQIVNGAPFDVLMAADRRRPQQLIERGLAVAGSEQIYAIGQLGLWWRDKSEKLAVEDLANLEPRSVCMANPAFSPYGQASRDVLRRAGVHEDWLQRMVRVDNVSLVTGLVAQGQAAAGFVARSALMAGIRRGTVVAREKDLLWFSEVAAIDQAMVILARAEKNAAAQYWTEQMQVPAIRELIRRDGYRLALEQD